MRHRRGGWDSHDGVGTVLHFKLSELIGRLHRHLPLRKLWHYQRLVVAYPRHRLRRPAGKRPKPFQRNCTATPMDHRGCFVCLDFAGFHCSINDRRQCQFPDDLDQSYHVQAFSLSILGLRSENIVRSPSDQLQVGMATFDTKHNTTRWHKLVSVQCASDVPAARRRRCVECVSEADVEALFLRVWQYGSGGGEGWISPWSGVHGREEVKGYGCFTFIHLSLAIHSLKVLLRVRRR